MAARGKFVEVPKWRIKEYEPIDVDAGDEESGEYEDVSEAAVLRRHSRLEQDEKRRKRWDSQRVREESYLEKLKRKQEERETQRTQQRRKAAGRRISEKVNSKNVKGGGGAAAAANEQGKVAGKVKQDSDEEELKDSEGDILYVRVSDEVPISIFGHPLPVFEKTEFDLLWMNNDDSPPTSPKHSDCSAPPSIPDAAITPYLQHDCDLNLSPLSSLPVSSNPQLSELGQHLPLSPVSCEDSVSTPQPLTLSREGNRILPGEDYDYAKLNVTNWLRR